MAERVGRRKGARRGLLTRRELEIVRRDWTQVEAGARHAAALFYERLFALDPALRKLFGCNIVAQGQKLMNVLGTAVHGLGQPEVFLPIVEHLGRKHKEYGVENSDYLTFGLALFSTLQEILGAGFASENAIAWMNLYAVLADTMRGGGAAPAVSAAAPRRPRRPP